MKKKYKIIKQRGKNNVVLFVPNDYLIYYLPNQKLEWAEKIISQESESKIGGVLIPVGLKPERLNRLVLGVSNKCNLSCKYCYANGGSYNSDRYNMNELTMEKTISKFYKSFKSIEHIQFFGGEPLLNFQLIKKTVKYINKLNLKVKKPEFGIVTNLTLLKREMMPFFKENDFHFTVSLDGPKEINDILRVDKMNNGTFDIISKNIEMLEENEIRYEFEATYTPAHIKKNISIYKVLSFFYKNFNKHSIHLVQVAGKHGTEFEFSHNEKKYLLESYKDAAEKTINSLFSNAGKDVISFSYLDRILENIVNKVHISNLCPAGDGTLAVWYNGEVYPCFMLYGENKYIINNVYEEDSLFVARLKSHYDNWYKNLMKERIKSCRDCWVKDFCSGCIGGNLIAENNIGNPVKTFCFIFKGLSEYVIFKLAELKQDKIKWERFKSNLQKQQYSKREKNTLQYERE